MTSRRIIAALDRITTLLLGDLPLPAALQAAVAEISAASGWPIVVLELYEPSLQIIECVAVTGTTPQGDLVGSPLPAEQTLTGSVVRSGEAVLATEAQVQPAFIAASLSRLGARSLVCVPLRAATGAIGALTLAHPRAVVCDAASRSLAQHLAHLLAVLVARRQTEGRASVDTQQLSAILDNLAAGVIQIDAEGRYHYVNRRAVEALGLTPHQVIGHSIFDVLPPDVAELELERYRAILAAQVPSEYEVGFDTPVGPRSFFMVGQPLGAMQSAEPTLLLSGVDITKRRQAEKLVAAQRDLAHIITTATSPAAAWLRCLALAQQISGMDSGGLYLLDADAQNLELVAYAGLGEAFVQTVRQYPVASHQARLALSGGAPYYTFTQDELLMLGTPAEEGMCALVIIPLHDHKQVLGCINLGSHTLTQIPVAAYQAFEMIGTEIGNIVIYLRTEAALRQSRLQVELALKGANLGMWDWEVQTNHVVYNERWAGIVGYTLAELAPLSFRTWTSLCHPDDLQRSELLLHQHIIGASEFFENEIRMRHKDGSWVWVSSRGQVVDWAADGTPLRMVGTHLDITARKQAELTLHKLNETLERTVAERTAALQASQERLTLATSSAGIGIWDWDIVANTLVWDERMYELYGITPETFDNAYEAWFNGLHPDDRAEAERVSLRARRGEQEYDTEFRVCHPDGNIRTLKAYAFIQRSPTGTPLRMIGVNIDTTERKRAEEALRENEQQYRTLVETMTQGVIVYQDKHVVFCNKAAAFIIGRSVDELIGASAEELSRLLSEDGVIGLNTRFEAALLGVSSFSTPFRFARDHDNEPRWVISDANPTSYNGRPAMLVILSDVTALKLTEEQLRLSKARLHLLLAKTPAVIFSALAMGDFHTTYISDSVQHVLGYEPTRFLDSTSFLASRIHPDDVARVFGDIQQLRQQGWRQYEYRCRHADGSYRWIESGVSLLTANAGYPDEVIGYMIDITERKQAEEILRQANLDMIRAAQLKDEFLANMSHELRSPLNAILGYAECLHSGVYGPLGERQQSAIAHVESSGQHLLALVTDILDLSKIEAGRLTIAVEPITIAEVCQASLLFVKQLALKKSLKLTFALSDPHASMEADPKRLKQMLVNLLSNAVKFTPEGGSVSLEVTLPPGKEVVRFAVRDTGIGIAPEDQARLFQPFMQLDSRLSRQHEGTGLGLALVRRLAELHGGNVTLESEPGVGSCFTLILPLQG